MDRQRSQIEHIHYKQSSCHLLGGSPCGQVNPWTFAGVAAVDSKPISERRWFLLAFSAPTSPVELGDGRLAKFEMWKRFNCWTGSIIDWESKTTCAHCEDVAARLPVAFIDQRLGEQDDLCPRSPLRRACINAVCGDSQLN